MNILPEDQKVIKDLTEKNQTHFITAIDDWERDYAQAEIRAYTFVDARLNENGTYTVKYWDRNWSQDPHEHIVIAEKTYTKEEFLNDIKERNEFIKRTIERYERQKHLNCILVDLISKK